MLLEWMFDPKAELMSVDTGSRTVIAGQSPLRWTQKSSCFFLHICAVAPRSNPKPLESSSTLEATRRSSKPTLIQFRAETTVSTSRAN